MMYFGDRFTVVGLEVTKKMVTKFGAYHDDTSQHIIKHDYINVGFGGDTDKDVC